MTDQRDTIYSTTLGDPGLFTFNDAVVGVFPDMIKRSVPGYTTVIAMTGLLAGRHARRGTYVYDLGCSLGASLLSAARNIEHQECNLVGIDNSAAMLSQCQQTLNRELPDHSVQLIEGDITVQAFEPASVFILNYTLQFVAKEKRLPLLRQIRAALQPGDILILSEKIDFEEPEIDALMIDLHHDFKLAQGYSELEVAKKRQALENVLLPESRQCHVDRLRDAGFSHCEFWFQCFNFASLVAVA